ncbi:DVU_1557 family redox protein [Clostridium formicaceticum]|uniref:DNA-binding protein n=1 Tax=Clostridium formicaceticum TaxID=1497 RepID=A0AAC9RJW1_9CLOT|nr:CLJU_RS11820 family redox protein [Clostridium formicaceticum]AOY76454.1 DNA-binding protein [Clostridium formicaceticum]ARE86852.1 hypothetical protein CLFO_11830 [Clostridium formicaceticum]
MKTQENTAENKWLCKCGGKMELSKVKITYLNGKYDVELLKCSCCDKVLISEDLATGKMLEVEKILEDK